MKTIVVLGAGMAAAVVIRQTMRNVVLKKDDYKLIVVAPNTHMLYPIAMPRLIVPGQMEEDKAVIPLEVQFKQYPASKFEHILGVAEKLDVNGKVVAVKLNDKDERREVSYDKLIVATGSASRDHMPWKTEGTTEQLLEKLHKVQGQIGKAKTIVVAGGGATGTETAGELGSEYGKAGTKEIYFVYRGAYPLGEDIIEGARKQAAVELTRQNIKLLPNTTVSSVTTEGDETVLQLTSADGKEQKTIRAGAYIPALGIQPNSSFVPADLLDSHGQIVQTKTLHAKGQKDILVAGDVGSLEASKAQMADAQSVHLAQNIAAYLLEGKDIPEYQLDTKNAMAVTLGRSKGTGQMGTWKLPSFMVWFLKGRTMFTQHAEPLARGVKTAGTVLEK